MEQVLVFHRGVDVSDKVEKLDGQSNPFGWSYSLWGHGGHEVLSVNCGVPELTADAVENGYTMTITELE